MTDLLELSPICTQDLWTSARRLLTSEGPIPPAKKTAYTPVLREFVDIKNKYLDPGHITALHHWITNWATKQSVAEQKQ